MPPIVPASLQSAVEGIAPGFSARDFRDAMGQFATGVVVISTEIDGDAHAMTANAFMSGSLEPPLVLVSVALTAKMHEKIRSARRFGVSVLAQDQLAASNHFAGRPAEGYAPEFDLLNGLPVIRGAAVNVSAALEHAYPCGDHTLYVGRVLALRGKSERPPPLLFHGGRYAAAQPIPC
jgi:flavin reductase (DIM6/NTAB) family NADH-FMN oxidoreductase RutF